MSFLHQLVNPTSDKAIQNHKQVYNREESLIDFKTAKKVKPKEWIEDYFLQCSAYANAHNVMYGTNINQIVILMVDRDQEYKKFIVNNREFDHYTGKWKQRLIKFHNKVRKEI